MLYELKDANTYIDRDISMKEISFGLRFAARDVPWGNIKCLALDSKDVVPEPELPVVLDSYF